MGPRLRFLATAARTVSLAVVLAAVLLPTSATAETARVPDRAGDSSAAVDITGVRYFYGNHRIRAVVDIPRLRPGRLSGLELLIKPEGRRQAYAVVVLRDRQGAVVEKDLGWRPINDPVELQPLACQGIRTGRSAARTTVSVATSCLSRTGDRVPVRMKIRTINGTTGLADAYFDDQTRLSPWLLPGSTHSGGAGAEGRVTANGGEVVRGLPTVASARRGALPAGQVVPLSCRITGSVVRRNDDQDGELSNVWYRLPGDGPQQWVSALYVEASPQPPPRCGTRERFQGRVTTGLLRLREAPTTRANSHSGLRRGEMATIVCRSRGQAVDGDRSWYYLASGLWVSAHYLRPVGPRAGFCVE